MKRTLTGIAAAAVVLGTLAPAAFASTPTSLTSGGGKTISVDGKTLYTGVQVGNATEAGSVNAYFPIWYLQQALDQAGYTNTYDPGTHVWNLQIPGVDGSKVAVDGGVGSGNSALAINGFVVKRFNAVWNKDLAGGPKADTTTYFPLFYLTKALAAAGFPSAWDGNNFGFQSNYGTASAVQVSAASSNLVASNLSTTTVTANVVDANGHVVRNFSGSATVHFDTTTGAFEFVPSTDTNSPVSYGDGTATTTNSTIKFVNGVATFTVVGGNVPGLTDKIEIQNLLDSNGVAVSGYQAPSLSLSTVPQTATAVSVKAANGEKYIAVNDSSQHVDFDVQVNDQEGNPMLGGTYTLSAAVTGGGTFTDTTTSGKTVVVSSGAPQTVTVDGVQGKTGTYTLTVTGTGLTSGSASLTAATAGLPAKLAVSDATPSFTQADAAGTTYTLSATDENGVPVTIPGTVAPEVFVTDANGNAVTNVTVSSVTAGSDDGYQLPAGTTSIVIKDPTTTQADAGKYNITVKDTSSNALASVSSSYTENASTTVAKVAFASPSYSLSASNANATITLQAEDAYGNPIAAPSGAKATFDVAGGQGVAKLNGSTNPVDVLFDSTGKASVSFSAQDYTTDWTVTATPSVGGVAAQSVDVLLSDHPAASFSFGLEDNTTQSKVYAKAGDQIKTTVAGVLDSLVNSANDSNGNATVADYDPVTLVVSHASGVSGLPTTATGVTYAANTTNDTATLTGSLTDVSAAIDGATIDAAKAGVVSFRLTDNATNATGSGSITVVAGTTVAGVAAVPELKNATTLAKSSTVAFTVTLVDAGGNPVVAATDTTETISSTITGLTFQDANHLPITSTITVKAGQSSATGYLVVPASGSGTVTVGNYTSGNLTVQ